MVKPPESHPLYDHRDLRFRRPQNCPDPLCVLDAKEFGICNKCPRQLEKTSPLLAPHSATQPPPPERGWGGKRRGAGAPRGNLSRLKHGNYSSLVKHAIDVLVEYKELRPFLLLIARAAIEGEIPQTTRRLILKSLGKKTLGIEKATIALRRLRHAKTAR